MEMRAVIEGLHWFEETNATPKIEVLTDSSYVIQGITKWIFGWIKNGWKTQNQTPIANVDLWQELHILVKRVELKAKIEWILLPGHAGIPGNEACDQIAVAFSKGLSPSLFDGSYSKYGYDLFNRTPSEQALKEKKKKPKGKAFSYLSLVGSVLMRHASWEECERRVKGQTGAKFKRSESPEDEIQIAQSWGTSIDKAQ
jgi:ribonuclease HI